MVNSNIQEKSKKFAIRIVMLYKHLVDRKSEFVLSKQILRSGTSIGANTAEAFSAISKKDFLSKMYIAFKESVETRYWLELLYETQFINEQEFASINTDCTELIKLLSSITKTTNQRIKTKAYQMP